MLRLLRTIRRKLVGEGNVRKYLFYAIGEILLVVIGIVIALQVHNWNEERRRHAEERHYLAALHADFESAESWLRILLGAVQEQLDHNERLLTLLAGPVGNVPGDSLVGMLRKAFIDVPFGVQVTAYNDLLNSGKLAVIQSEELRRALSGFETANVLTNSYAEKAAAQWAGQVTEFFIMRLNVSAIYGSESDVTWNDPGIPPSIGYRNTPLNTRFSSDEEALWGRELANRVAIKNVVLEDTARSARDVLQLIEEIYTLIDASS
jgi:hypothetical protein